MFRRIGRSFKEAWWGITHHFAMVTSTANAITITLVIVSVLSLLVFNVSQITYDVEEEIQILVKIDKDLDESAIPNLQAKVKRIAGVSEVEYSNPDNELSLFIDKYGEAGKIFEIYRDDNPLSPAFIVTVTQGYTISSVSEQIETIDGIAEVDFGGASIEDFIILLNGVREVGFVLVAALTFLAVFLIYNTIKLTIQSRKDEIGIMRLVGATNSYIRVPLVLEGIFIGILGSIIPVCLTIFGYKYLYETMDGQLVSGILKLIDVFPFTLYVSAIIVAMGVIVGWIGSFMAASKYLRWKR